MICNQAAMGPVRIKAMTAPVVDRDFVRLSEFIQSRCGIKMPPGKRVMLEARLQKRLRILGLASIREYCDYLFSETGERDELAHFIDAVTTNKTDFFREPGHFNVLVRDILPEFLHRNEGSRARCFSVWSAACSSGEEPYTLAMVMADFAERRPGFRFSLLATDISTRMLEKAQLAIYDRDQAGPVPPALGRKYLMRSKDSKKRQVRIVPELRAQVAFQRLNLMDQRYGMVNPMDVVFCRNVLIYFDRMTQYEILARITGTLRHGGYLFLGHSENVYGLDLPLERVASTIYRKA